MKLEKYLYLVIILSILFKQETYSQSLDFDCGSVLNENANNSVSTPFEGLYKPNRTDTLYGSPLPEDAFLPVLIVFVQFKNEGDDPRHTWNSNSPPTYLSNLIATQKRTSGDWWNYYNESTEILSDQWMETSRGKLHVVSPSPTGTGAFSIVLSKEASYYAAFGNQQAELIINSEIWRSLDSQGVTDWRPYDRWKKDSTGFVYTPFGQGDGLVDMIFKVHKSRNNGD